MRAPLDDQLANLTARSTLSRSPAMSGTPVSVEGNVSSTRPRGSRSGRHAARNGRSVRGCYAAALKDCGGELEAEHFVSKVLLRQLGKTFAVSGMPWAGPKAKSSPKALKAHVLCKRHNNALSPVDEAAGRFHRIMLAATNGENIGNAEFDGDDLERWSIKLLLGANASGNISNASGGALHAGEPRSSRCDSFLARKMFRQAVGSCSCRSVSMEWRTAPRSHGGLSSSSEVRPRSSTVLRSRSRTASSLRPRWEHLTISSPA